MDFFPFLSYVDCSSPPHLFTKRRQTEICSVLHSAPPSGICSQVANKPESTQKQDKELLSLSYFTGVVLDVDKLCDKMMQLHVDTIEPQAKALGMKDTAILNGRWSNFSRSGNYVVCLNRRLVPLSTEQNQGSHCDVRCGTKCEKSIKMIFEFFISIFRKYSVSLDRFSDEEQTFS